MLAINLTSLKPKRASQNEIDKAYESLKEFKKKSAELEAFYKQKGIKKPEIVA